MSRTDQNGLKIISMKREDAGTVAEMMQVFYASPAVLTDGSEEIFRNDIENCVNDSPYLEGYIFKKEGNTAGYAMLARSFSTEFGKPCIWIEDIYLLPEYRGKGIAACFFSFVEEKYQGAVLRLEAEKENEYAIRAYRKNGFEELPYMELKKEARGKL